MDLDPVIPSTRDSSSPNVPLISTEDRVQVETPSKVEDDKKAGFLNPFKEEEQKGAPLGHSKDPSFQDFADAAPDTVKTSEKGAGYNPKRIPSSVFSRSDSTPADWSNASNESLFSLQGGNVSFGRDQAFLLAAESRKHREYHREESKKSDEVTVVNPLPASAEDGGGTDNAGETEVVEEEVEVVKQEEVVEVEEEEEEESPKEDKPKEDVEKTQKQEAKSSFAVTCQSNVSYRSDGSEGSTFSFAFPILAPGSGPGPSGSAKVETPSPSTQTRHSSEPHSGAGNTTETPPQPPQPPPATKRKGKSKRGRYFSCFSSQSSHSCSCWPFKR